LSQRESVCILYASLSEEVMSLSSAFMRVKLRNIAAVLSAA